MARYAAFLRGINVGGHRVSGDELRALFTQLGFEGVATFRASGNVVFGAAGGERPEEIAERIERGLAGSLGYEVPAFVRSASAVKAIAGHRPFDSGLVEASGGKLQVLLLLANPSSQARRKVLGFETDEDLLAIRGRELYWLPSGGIRDSDLDLNEIEALLGAATMRTKGTIDQIAAKHFSD